MKTEPTETDRLAAQLFAPAGGMRAAWRGERNGVRPVWERLRDGSEATPDFYDTDDPATVGCMLAQVEEALDAVGCPGAYLHPWAGGWAVRRGTALRRYPGPTKGAALVAAMKALKSAT